MKLNIKCKRGGWVNSILSTLLWKILKVSEAPEDFCVAQQLKLTFISREWEGEMKPSLWDVADFQSARDQKQQHDCCCGNCSVQLINHPPPKNTDYSTDKKTSLFFFRKINSKEEDLFNEECGKKTNSNKLWPLLKLCVLYVCLQSRENPAPTPH